MTVRGKVLAEARELTEGDRGQTHGDPVENLARSAAMLNAAFDTKFNAADVAMIYQILKQARMLAGDPNHRDHYVDCAAYAAIQWECQDRIDQAFGEMPEGQLCDVVDCEEEAIEAEPVGDENAWLCRYHHRNFHTWDLNHQLQILGRDPKTIPICAEPGCDKRAVGLVHGGDWGGWYCGLHAAQDFTAKEKRTSICAEDGCEEPAVGLVHGGWYCVRHAVQDFAAKEKRIRAGGHQERRKVNGGIIDRNRLAYQLWVDAGSPLDCQRHDDLLASGPDGTVETVAQRRERDRAREAAKRMPTGGEHDRVVDRAAKKERRGIDLGIAARKNWPEPDKPEHRRKDDPNGYGSSEAAD